MKRKIILVHDEGDAYSGKILVKGLFGFVLFLLLIYTLFYVLAPHLNYDVSIGEASHAQKKEAGLADLLTGGMGNSSEGKKSEVKRVRANDSQLYYVASSLPEEEQLKAANKLAQINRKAQALFAHLAKKQAPIKAADGLDISENIQRLLKRHHNRPLPIAEYHNPGDNVVGYNMEKGDVIELCVRSKTNPSEMNSDNTLFRVALHELAHSADKEYRGDGESNHGPDFKRLHQYLLGEAETLGLYNCDEYERSGKKFCGLTLTEDYCGA